MVGKESDKFGVYELGNDDDILYIGEGKVHDRLMAHFPKGSDPIVGSSHYRVEYTGGKKRCKERQNAELRAYYRAKGRYPKFNSRKG